MLALPPGRSTLARFPASARFNGEPDMKVFLTVLAVAACALAEGVSIYLNASRRQVPVAASPPPAVLPGVEVTKLSKGASYSDAGVELTGRLEAGPDVEIRSDQSGYAVRIATVKTTVDVGEWEYPQVVPALEARVAIDGVPNRDFVGKVIDKAPAVNPRTHTAPVFVEIANPDRVLKPGMSARVRLLFDRNKDFRVAEQRRPDDKGSSSPTSPEPIVNPQAVTEVLSSLKGFAVTMSAAAKDVETRKVAAAAATAAAAQATIEVSNRYFKSLEKLVGELRYETNNDRVGDFERVAEKIDSVPILHVDEELLAFGSDVSKTLRDIAEQRRAIARTSGTADWATQWDRMQRECNAIKSKGMQKIINGLADMRQKLTKKYNLEFLATAGSARPSSRNSRHPRR